MEADWQKRPCIVGSAAEPRSLSAAGARAVLAACSPKSERGACRRAKSMMVPKLKALEQLENRPVC
jgi:hypothetical protein